MSDRRAATGDRRVSKDRRGASAVQPTDPPAGDPPPAPPTSEPPSPPTAPAGDPPAPKEETIVEPRSTPKDPPAGDPPAEDPPAGEPPAAKTERHSGLLF